MNSLIELNPQFLSTSIQSFGPITVANIFIIVQVNPLGSNLFANKA